MPELSPIDRHSQHHHCLDTAPHHLSVQFVRAHRDVAYTAHTFALNSSFGPVLEERLRFFNTDPEAMFAVDKIGSVQRSTQQNIGQMQSVRSRTDCGYFAHSSQTQTTPPLSLSLTILLYSFVVSLYLSCARCSMEQNIDLVLERGEKIDLLVEKTEALDQNAFKFERSAKAVKYAMFWKKVKMYMVRGCVVV